MEQRSSAWHQWRGKGIGSSDAPIIMGLTKFSTPRKLWRLKKGLMPADAGTFSNPAIARGVKYEPKARALYELKYDMPMSEALFESPVYPFLRASLDGFNHEHEIVLEIKVPSKEVFEQAKDGQVDEYYIWQLEHQLLVTGGKEAHFYCVQVNEATEQVIDDALVIYKSDQARRAQLVDKELEFWNMLQNDIEPPLTDDDALERSEPEVIEIYKKIKELKLKTVEIDSSKQGLEKELDELKAQAIALMKHTNETCEGVQLRRSIRKEFDKKKAKAAGVNIESFEKETVYYSLRVSK